MHGLPPLTETQRSLADAHARCSVAAADAQGRLQPDGFVSVRDTNSSAKQVGTEVPDWRAERDMVRVAGFGRFKTGALLGSWSSLVNASYEAARFYGETIDVAAVSRLSLAWCLADRPKDDPIAELAKLALDISTDDIHNEQIRPSYRQLLDGWRQRLPSPTT